jgi:aspartyl-tRNA(Asn)/glutamyl-tRNA(Gln) amidotransferase subunit A
VIIFRRRDYTVYLCSVNPLDARNRARELAHLNAFISLTEEEGEGQVVAVKDLVDVRGTVTTGGGVILPKTASADDAPVVARMRRGGCVVVGKTNLHEWAFGVTSQNPHYGGVRNPRDHRRIPGGSSGGSAAAVAAGLCDWAVGSDTGGSIRIPAAFCGVVGFKPTIGTVDTTGVIPLSRSLDTLGPLAPDVTTAARALEAMSELTGLVPAGGPRQLDQLRVAVPRGWGDDLDEVNAAAWTAVSRGLPEIDFHDRDELGDAGLTILFREAADFHRAWVERHPDLYGNDVLMLLRRGLETSRAAYVQALLDLSRLREEAERAMAGWDALLVPATRIAPPLLEEPYERADLTAYTRPFNTTGHPVISLPAPVQGLPVGIQVVGHLAAEAQLVEVALALEASWA